MKQDVPAVILTGGSEVVALSVVESLYQQDVPLILISLGKTSILRGIDSVIAYRELPWPPSSSEAAIDALSGILSTCPAQEMRPWPVFATEDSGQRLLFEGRDTLSHYLSVPMSRALSMGGLDKAELFQFLSNKGFSEYLPKTLVLDEIDSARMAFQELGVNAVFKPALKPYSMDHSGLQGKILTQKSPSESEDSILNRLSRVWPLSEKWIVQEKLQSGESAEFQWGGVRTLNGKTHRRVATERWKQPAEGGTACWVELGIHPEIEAIGDQIAETLDLIGMAEMAFMYDATQHLRLIEANTRAWLQIALFDLSGMELVYSTYRTLLNLPSTTPHQSELPNADWVNPERMLLTALSGAYGNPLSAIIRALTIIRKANHISVYQTTFPKVRSRWLGHLLRTTSRC